MRISLQQKPVYQQRVDAVCPQTNLLTGCIKAYTVGGLICVIGQILSNLFITMGLDIQTASTWTSISLIFLGSLITGLGLYDNLGHYAGAGSIIPITGFANGVVSSAIEFKKEGFIMGLGAKMFTVAGPVIVYGIFISSMVGLVYWLIGGVL